MKHWEQSAANPNEERNGPEEQGNMTAAGRLMMVKDHTSPWRPFKERYPDGR